MKKKILFILGGCVLASLCVLAITHKNESEEL